jgi:hypothetical protein
MTTVKTQRSLGGLLGAAWGIAGFSLILLDAINRLARISWQALGTELSGAQWGLVLLVVVLMAYSEGYRGFQKSFSPRSAARAYYLYRHPEPVAVLFAPLFCMGFFRATRKPLLFAWVGTLLIIMLVVALQATPQPWRGIVDAGVVVGLSWGLLSFWIFVWRAFATGEYPVAPAVPQNADVSAQV